MGTRIKKIILIVLALLFISFIQSCEQIDSNKSYIELIELIKTNNKCIHVSNKSIISISSNNTTIKLQIKLFEEFDDNVYKYFGSFCSDFIFKLENGKNNFFDADTIKIFQIKNWKDKDFIYKYNTQSIDSLNSKISKLNKKIKSFTSSKFYFDETKIHAIVAKLNNDNNNAYDELKIIEMIKNYYLISLNKIILDSISQSLQNQ